MNPFYDPFNPYGLPIAGIPPFFPFLRRRGTVVPRLDRLGVPLLVTTGMVENTESEEDTVDYGINPCVWRALPCQTIALWKVRHPVTDNGASLPVMLAVPTGNSSTTVTSKNSVAGTTKIPVVDNKSTQVEGRDVTVPTGSGSSSPVQTSYATEHWVYIDKAAGIFRLLGVTAQNSPARAAQSNTPATPENPTAASLKTAKANN